LPFYEAEEVPGVPLDGAVSRRTDLLYGRGINEAGEIDDVGTERALS
jgi:hypothetical protein